MLKLAIKNSVYGMIGQLVIAILGLLFSGMTIKYLGPSLAGFFLLISAILGWVQFAGGGAFHAPAVQKLAKISVLEEKNIFSQIVGTVISANIFVSIPFALGLIIAFPTIFSWSQLDIIYRDKALLVTIFAACTFLLNQYSSSLVAIYEGLQKFDIVAILKIIFGLFGNILKLIVLIRFQDMVVLALTMLFISIIRLLTDLILVNSLIGNFILPTWNLNTLRPLLSFGLWNWVTNTGNIIFINVTGVILTRFLGSEALVYVSLPQAIILQVGGLIISSSYFMFPAFASQGESIYEKVRNLDDRVRWFIGLISFTVYTGLFLAGSQLLSFLVNPKYAEAAFMPLLYFCIYGIIWAQEIFYIFSIMATGKNLHIGAIVHITTTSLIMIATVILVPKIGYIGMPIAYLLKSIGVVWLTIWSRSILGLKNSLSNNFSPFISPFIGSLLWTMIMLISKSIYSESVLLELVFWVSGFIISLMSIVLLESFFFIDKKRLFTLKIALSIAFKSFSPRISNWIKKIE